LILAKTAEFYLLFFLSYHSLYKGLIQDTSLFVIAGERATIPYIRD